MSDGSGSGSGKRGKLVSILEKCLLSVNEDKLADVRNRKRGTKCEHASFTPLVLSACGGLATGASTFYKRLASLLAEKWEQPYRPIMPSHLHVCCLHSMHRPALTLQEHVLQIAVAGVVRIRYNHYYLAEMHPVLQSTTVCYSMHPRCALTLWVCCLRWTWCLLVTSFVIILYFLLLAFVVLLNSIQKKGTKCEQQYDHVPTNVQRSYCCSHLRASACLRFQRAHISPGWKLVCLSLQEPSDTLLLGELHLEIDIAPPTPRLILWGRGVTWVEPRRWNCRK